MPHGSGRWRLVRFLEELDAWIERERLESDDVKLIVLPWIQSRMDDPYRDVRRSPEIDNLWWGPIPGTLGSDGRIVCGSYFVFETDDLIRCNSFALLSPPL